jgi:hypothetical protein
VRLFNLDTIYLDKLPDSFTLLA